MNYQNEREISSELEAGLTPEEISKKWKVKLHLIYKYIDRFGLKSSETYRSKEWLTEQYINRSKTTAQISDELGISKSLLLKYLRKFEEGKVCRKFIPTRL